MNYIYDDENNNWVKDTWEKTRAWWKVVNSKKSKLIKQYEEIKKLIKK